MSFFVYILYSSSTGKFYKGQTNNVVERLKEHNRGNEISTKSGVPWQLLWTTEKPSKSEAVILEKKLKNLTAHRLINFMLKYENDVVDLELLHALDEASSSQ